MNTISNIVGQIHDHYVGKACMITLGTGYGCMAATDVLVTMPKVFDSIWNSPFPWNKFFSRTLKLTDSFASSVHLGRIDPGIWITSTPDVFLHDVKKGDKTNTLPDDLSRIGFLFPFIITDWMKSRSDVFSSSVKFDSVMGNIMLPEKPNMEGNDQVDMFYISETWDVTYYTLEISILNVFKMEIKKGGN